MGREYIIEKSEWDNVNSHIVTSLHTTESNGSR